MFWLSNRRKCYKQQGVDQKDAQAQIDDIKAKFQKTSTKTKADVDRLNRLLESNGITLKIQIATGGHSHG